MPEYTEGSFQGVIRALARATNTDPPRTGRAIHQYFTYHFLVNPNNRNNMSLHLTVSFYAPTGSLRIGGDAPNGFFRKMCRILHARDAPRDEWDQFHINTTFGLFLFQYRRLRGNRTAFWMWSEDDSESREVINLTKRLFFALKAIQHEHAGGAASVTAEEER
jgi:hypothetical protein